MASMIVKDLNADAIAFRGLSGALVAPLVARELNIGMIAIRKRENCHSYDYVEGCIHEAENIIILDDLVSSGATIRAILEEMRAIRTYVPVAGIVLYNDEYTNEAAGLPCYAFCIDCCTPLFNTRISMGDKAYRLWEAEQKMLY